MVKTGASLKLSEEKETQDRYLAACGKDFLNILLLNLCYKNKTADDKIL